jgi:hypothetical protein
MKKLMYRLVILGSLALTTSSNAALHAQTTKKSKKAKYTAIGAGVGAGTGIILGKNDSKSGIIGGAVGAGAGYMYGRHKDKKNGVRKKGS